MAARRSSGTIAPLVILLVGNVALLGICYWLWQAKDRAETQARQAIAERDQAKKERAAAVSRLESLKPRVVRTSDLDFDQLLAAIDDDLRQFGAGTPNESYADIVRRLQGTIDSLHTELKQLTADKDRLQTDYLALERIKRQAVDVADAASQEARADLKTEQTEFSRKLVGKDQEIQAVIDRASTLASKLLTEQRDKERIREELMFQVNKLRKILEEARAPYTPTALATQKPDGKVIRSSAATKTAFINIGSKDGVQPQLTFSVQPANFSGNPFTKPKAKLEVLRVVSGDLSEARITDVALVNPVIDGDLIYNPAWNPGKVMRFALAGLLDFDDDGVDDREKIKQIIKVAGAKVDAEILPDGTERGEVSVETNFFVRGIRPDPERAGPVQLRVLSAMAKMERTARDYGAVVIDLDKFLDVMGYSPPRRLSSSSGPPSLRPGTTPAAK